MENLVCRCKSGMALLSYAEFPDSASVTEHKVWQKHFQHKSAFQKQKKKQADLKNAVIVLSTTSKTTFEVNHTCGKASEYKP